MYRAQAAAGLTWDFVELVHELVFQLGEVLRAGAARRRGVGGDLRGHGGLRTPNTCFPSTHGGVWPPVEGCRVEKQTERGREREMDVSTVNRTVTKTHLSGW